MSTKGSWFRPHNRKKYEDNWDKIFGKGKKNEKEKTKEKITSQK